LWNEKEKRFILWNNIFTLTFLKEFCTVSNVQHSCCCTMKIACNNNPAIIVFCLILLFLFSYVYIYYYFCVCSIKFFAVCSLVGLVVLLPVNYGAQEVQNGSHFTMDSFTISNVKIGSNRWGCFGRFRLGYLYDDLLFSRVYVLWFLTPLPWKTNRYGFCW